VIVFLHKAWIEQLDLTSFTTHLWPFWINGGTEISQVSLKIF